MKTKAKQNKNLNDKKGNKRKKSNQKNETINLDNEIIIGLNTKVEEKKEPVKKKNKKTVRATNKKTIAKKKVVTKKTQRKKETKANVLKWTTIIIISLTGLVLILLSDLFNIKEINVLNNNNVSTEEIINLSGIKKDENMFKFLNAKIKAKLKENAYIEDVQIKKNLNGTVLLDIKERDTAFMLKIEAGYAYINNQGYILEKTTETKDVPIIEGYETKDLEVGTRLINEDLKKLDTIVQIMETSKNKQFDVLITEIDITNKSDYILKIQSENKIVHFGDCSNINEKMLWTIAIVEQEKGHEGEIFVNDISKIFFREKV